MSGPSSPTGAAAGARALDAVPAPGLVIVAIVSTQVGSAFAKGLFDQVGPTGTVLLRVGVAAVVLLALWRPQLRGHSGAELRLLAAFGLALAAMNLCFYESIERIPLGVAVTVEFIGPLGVAVAGSRRLLDGLWVVLAAAGVVLLAEGGAAAREPAGLALALLAGAFWAAYIVLSARAGRAFPGGSGLALAMLVGAVVLAPVGVAGAGAALADPGVLAAGAGVAALSSVIPYSLELESLRRLPARVFGILMSLEPAMAAVAGFLILGESLAVREQVAIAFVVVASAGASLAAGPRAPIDG